SDDIAVKVFIPFEIDPTTYLFQQLRQILLIVLPLLLLGLLLYFGWPAIEKAYARSRRRSWAMRQGVRERIAVAYADWRDAATDFGYLYSSDTPLMFLSRVVPDEEHEELAWLATRTLWGDLQTEISPEDATAAEELSASLRKRLSQAHSISLRAVAKVSRLSLRNPYAPTLTIMSRRGYRRAA
ncbi:MAG: hypothetical protein ACRD1T_26760, partial [Acidimicrobiia bacterium]